MFQYSVGRQLAEIHKTELKLDVTGFDKYSLRSYGLGVFQIQDAFATQGDIRAVVGIGQRLAQKLRQKLRLPADRKRTRYIKELEPGYDPEILLLSDNVYLDGYWQSEKYFSAIAHNIRREFTVASPQSGRNLELAAIMQDCVSVSVHIRRGDYISNPQTNRFHGVCDLDYYFRCISMAAEMTQYPHFFVFSDDLKWAQTNLKLTYPVTFIDNNGTVNAHEDLRLMSQCQHHIIANSSFSWWGAWLNARTDKIVFAPKCWLAAEGHQKKTNSIIPDTWLRV
ncbi:MAG: alpha-1,2-fucosyltransferase [Sulfuricaulis sp.]